MFEGDLERRSPRRRLSAQQVLDAHLESARDALQQGQPRLAPAILDRGERGARGTDPARKVGEGEAMGAPEVADPLAERHGVNSRALLRDLGDVDHVFEDT
jgi:hypothetical protein